MDWRVKALVQAVLSRIPYGPSVNEVLQRVSGGRRRSRIGSTIENQVNEVRDMVRALDSIGFSLKGKKVLELGTGWEPTISMFIAGLGAHVTTIDIRRNLRASPYARDRLCGTYEMIRGETSYSAAQVAAIEQYGKGELGVEGLISALGIAYVAPVSDSYLLTLPPSSFDVVFSIAVLEHVPPKDIELLLRGQKHVLKAGGVGYHEIGPGDHAAGFDPNVSYVNFLKYDGPFWRFLGESMLQYHNRLRRSDYDRLFESLGLRQVWKKHAVCDRSRTELRSGVVRPVRRFADYEIDDLATYNVRVILK